MYNPSQKNSKMASTVEIMEKAEKNTKGILSRDTSQQRGESFKKSLALMGITVLGGGLGVAILGRPSFLIGAGLTFAGCYKKDNPWLTPLGLGMMATGIATSNTVNGVEGFSVKNEIDKAKTRFVDLKDTLMRKTYLDEVIKNKSQSGSKSSMKAIEQTTDGFGSVNANLQALDQVEQKLIADAMAIQAKANPSLHGYDNYLNGLEEIDFSRL